MNKIRKLKSKQGFTLVECVVAIAVFALLVTVVLMIVANASAMTKKSTDSEKQLNMLVQNVVADNSKINWDKDSTEYLDFKISYSGETSATTMDDGEMSISYNEISGFKNFMKCPDCGYIADSSEFMYDTHFSKYTTRSLFNKVDDDHSISDYMYFCPKCATATGVQLSVICDNCDTTVTDVLSDIRSATSNFSYNRDNGGYVCLKCGGGYVHQTGFDQMVADASSGAFNISGITPNAFRYSSTEPMTNKKEIFPENLGDDMFVDLTYTPGAHYSSDDVYTLKVRRNGTALANGDYIKICVPKNYKFELLQKETSMSEVNFTTGRNYNVISFTVGTDQTPWIKFHFNNEKSNTSYDTDYPRASDGGLGGRWFGLSASGNNNQGVVGGTP